MVHLLQHSAGPGSQRRRMAVGVIFWFLTAGLIRGSLSSVIDEGKETSQNSTKRMFQDPTLFKKNGESSFKKDVNADPLLHRASRELPQTKNDNELLFDSSVEADGISEAIQKLPVKSKTFFVIPYFRPGRSDNKFSKKRNFDTVIPMARFGRFVSDPNSSGLNSENDISVTKRHETVIPTMRFGRDEGKRQSGYSNSVIPYPRLGRSSTTNEDSYPTGNNGESLEDDYFDISVEEGDITDKNEIHSTSLASKTTKKRGDHDTIIPYPRTGRQENNEADVFEIEDKREDYDYILPQIRYGRRSVVLLSSSKTDESIKQNPHTFVLPYPRPGRSSKYPENAGYSKNLQVILPYPRPGRSEFNFNEESLNWDKRQNNYMLPFARLGRSALKIPFENKENSNSNNDILNDFAVNSFPVKTGQKNAPEKFKESTTDLSSIFMIPYPRPGKKSLMTLSDVRGKLKENSDRKERSDYVLPYSRPGKKSSIQPYLKNYKSTDNENENARQFMVPYPRPGRSEENWFVGNSEMRHQENENKADDSMLANTEKNAKNYDIQSKSTNRNANEWKISKKSKNTFMVPYARLGRNAETAAPYVTLDMYTDYETDSGYDTYDYKKFTSEDNDFTDLHDDSSFHLRYKRSSSIVPYPRLGRSEMIIPYPRLGRSDTVVPYPRPGRSNFVIPHPRLGRSNSVVPYPRLGRADSVIPYPRLGRSNFVVPYPRLGRSNSVVPYPRPGRSNSVVPYPRLGRSDSVVPYPRPGRSDYIVPYPRLGRSDSVVPYPRPGRSDSVVPYPRPERSDFVVPYPRPGRSDSVVPYPRPGRSDSVVPYPRPGRSESLIPSLKLTRTNSFIPYTRAGRSNSVLPYPRLGRSESVLVFPRSRRSLTVVPYPRLGRSNKEEQKQAPKYGNWILPNIRPGRSESYGVESDVIPYPRPGRSQNDLLQVGDYDNRIIAKRLNEGVIIPYPRPGRTTRYDQGYVLPNLRFGRSQNNDATTNEPISYDTIIPYPRAGRSQEQVTPSPDMHSPPHKLNKHMLTRVDDSIYLLPYPRPGRYSE